METKAHKEGGNAITILHYQVMQRTNQLIINGEEADKASEARHIMDKKPTKSMIHF